MSWSAIINQERVKRLLSSALSKGRVAHAYLFVGPEGIGKDAVALEFAKVLNCSSPAVNADQLIEACGTCLSCRRASALEHPDIQIVFALPGGKSSESNDPLDGFSESEVQTIKAELVAKARDPYHRIAVPRASEIRIKSIRAMRRFASLSSSLGHWKVILIFNADEMNEEASDALLKTLEEPPPRTIFILTSAYPERLRPTVISRCENVQFDFLREEDIRHALVVRHRVAQSQAQLAARLSCGNYRRAVELLSRDLQEWRREVVDFIGYSVAGKYLALVEKIEQWSGESRELLAHRLELMLSWLRDVMFVQTGSPELIFNVDMRERLERFVDLYPDSIFNSGRVERALKTVEATIRALDRNVNTALALTLLALDLRRDLAESHAAPIQLIEGSHI